MPLEGQLPCLQEHWKQQVECDYAAQAHAACDDLVGIAVLGDIVDDDPATCRGPQVWD